MRLDGWGPFQLVGYDRFELLAERLAVEDGGDALARLHLTHVFFNVGWTLHVASVVGVFRIYVFDDLVVAWGSWLWWWPFASLSFTTADICFDL